mmetsp:Transcript_16086/g.49161  ORF Transcript_16086/g.49161 Transcript_16086/m.49161 type:complete len:239 (-) Transcript_16086:325-1041(-)
MCAAGDEAFELHLHPLAKAARRVGRALLRSAEREDARGEDGAKVGELRAHAHARCAPLRKVAHDDAVTGPCPHAQCDNDPVGAVVLNGLQNGGRRRREALVVPVLDQLAQLAKAVDGFEVHRIEVELLGERRALALRGRARRCGKAMDQGCCIGVEACELAAEVHRGHSEFVMMQRAEGAASGQAKRPPCGSLMSGPQSKGSEAAAGSRSAVPPARSAPAETVECPVPGGTVRNPPWP